MTSHLSSSPRRRIVTPAWAKDFPSPQPESITDPPLRGKGGRRAKSDSRAELPPLPGGDGFFITRPDVLLAYLGENVGFEIRSSVQLPITDADELAIGHPEAAADERENEAKEPAIRTSGEIATLCRQHVGFADAIAFEAHARLGERVTANILLSAARVGLWRAARRYEPTRNVTFQAFAKMRIVGEILDVLRAERIVPRRDRLRSPEIAAMLSACCYAPRPEELQTAEDIGWLASWRAESGVGVLPVAGVVALSGVVNRDQPTPDDALADAELLSALLAALAELEPRELALVDGVYFRGLTIEEASKTTRSWGSRMLGDVLLRLKRAMLRAGYRELFAADALPALLPKRHAKATSNEAPVAKPSSEARTE